jgi:hypothetical protein
MPAASNESLRPVRPLVAVPGAPDPLVRVHLGNGHQTSGGAGPGVVTCRRSEVAHLVASKYARIIEQLPEPEPEPEPAET